MCYLPAVMIMRSYFRRKYSVFIGFASCGIGVGSCVFPLVIEQLEVRVVLYIKLTLSYLKITNSTTNNITCFIKLL